MTSILVLLFSIVGLTPTSNEFLQEEKNLPIPTPEQHWTIRLTSGVWAPRLGGKVVLGSSPSATRVSLDQQLDLDDLELSFNTEITFYKDDLWQIELSGFYFETDNTGIFVGSGTFDSFSLSHGDPFHSSLEFMSASMEIAYWNWHPYEASPDRSVDLSVAPLIGARFVAIDQTVSSLAGPSDTITGEWVAPYIGFAMNMNYQLPDTFQWLQSLTLEGAIGVGPAMGGEGGSMSAIRIGVSGYLSDNAAITFGYRLVELDVSNDEYELQGGLQGLFFGGTLHF